MAARTIDDLPELASPSLNDRLKTGKISAADINLPARVNNRTIKVQMDGPLFSPEIPLTGTAPNKTPDAYFNGAQLAVRGSERKWSTPVVVFGSNSAGSVGSRDGDVITLDFGTGSNVDLRDFSDICFIYQGGWGRDVSPWYSLFFLMNRLRDLNGEIVNISGNRRTQGTQVEYRGDPTSLKDPGRSVQTVIVR